MRAVLAIASTTIGEAIRRRVLLIILFIGLFFLAVAPGLQVLSVRQERAVLVGMTLGVIQLTAAVIAIVLTIYMLPNEIERRTIYTILSKPVLRWQFFLGKYLGAVGALGLMMALMTIVLVLVFAIQQREYDPSRLAPLVKGPAMYFVQMSLLAAVAMFFSTFASPIVNFFLTGGAYLLGTLFNPFFQTLEENPQTPQIAKIFAMAVNTVLPNFANFNVQNPLINPGQVIQNEVTYYLQNIGYGIVYIGILLIAGILVFERREV